MHYHNVCQGIFLRRPNRFIAEVEIDGRTEICHVKNTGRCRELLIPGTEVYLQRADQKKRKTGFDVIAVRKGNNLVNIDSQVVNGAVEEWLRKGTLLKDLSLLKREVTFGRSRFDLYAEYENGKKAFLEVKGVTLEQGGVVRFPDAPTERGIRHLTELCECLACGYQAYLIFVIQMKGVYRMEPNWQTHRAFGETLVKAQQAGVHILAYDCLIQPDDIVLDQMVPVVLEQ